MTIETCGTSTTPARSSEDRGADGRHVGAAFEGPLVPCGPASPQASLFQREGGSELSFPGVAPRMAGPEGAIVVAGMADQLAIGGGGQRGEDGPRPLDGQVAGVQDAP